MIAFGFVFIMVACVLSDWLDERRNRKSPWNRPGEREARQEARGKSSRAD